MYKQRIADLSQAQRISLQQIPGHEVIVKHIRLSEVDVQARVMTDLPHKGEAEDQSKNTCREKSP